MSTCRRDLAVVLVLCVIAAVTLARAALAGEVFLTPEERAQAVAIARSDSRVVDVLDGGGVRVDDVLPWSADGTRETLMGAMVTFALEPPRTLEADWPLIDFPVDNAHYTITQVHFRADDVELLDVEVDFRRQGVVAFDIAGGTADEGSIRIVDAPSAAAESASGAVRVPGVLVVAGLGAALVAAGGVAMARGRTR
jgi:hypothetical protein